MEEPNKNEENIKKLSFLDQIKFYASNSATIAALAAKQKGKAAVETPTCSPEEVLAATHQIDPTQYAKLLEEQEKLLIEGAKEISDKQNKFNKTLQKESKEQENSSTITVEEMIVDDNQKIERNTTTSRSLNDDILDK